MFYISKKLDFYEKVCMYALINYQMTTLQNWNSTVLSGKTFFECLKQHLAWVSAVPNADKLFRTTLWS